MPSPFTHLHIAEKIRSEINKKKIKNKRLAEIIQIGWPAFYLGSVAPDFQTLSGHAREITHFYKLPPNPANQAYPKMFKRYPQLAQGDHLPIDHASFIAAYAAHLLLDLIWFRDVLIPYFHDATHLGDLQNRRLIHLILLTHIDKFAFDKLPGNAENTLGKAKPDNWLPFAQDNDLIAWQMFLIKQLQPGGLSETMRIYAGRLQMTPEVFADKLNDRGWMQEQLYSKIPVSKVYDIVYSAVPKSIEMLNKYLSGEFAT